MASPGTAEMVDSPNDGDPLDGTGNALETDGELTARASIGARPDEAEPTSWLWTLLVTVGVLALLAGFAVVAAPTRLVPTPGPETVGALRAGAVVVAGLAGIVGLFVAYDRSGTPTVDAGPDAVELPALPERSHGAVAELPGERLDEAIESVGGRVHGSSDVYSVMKVRSSLEGLAVRVLSTTADCSRERARERVERGTWTDDVRAAAFLGGEGVPDVPLSLRLRDWASGRYFERRVEATVDELARRSGVDES